MLAEQFHSLLVRGWQNAFLQQRTFERVVEHALATPYCYGQRTISRTICALDRHQQDWSADYKLYSRSYWNDDALFHPVIDAYLHRYPQGPICVAYDDTKLKKTGRKIPFTFWQRDPLSPPFHLNFLYGLRFIQASLIYPHYREGDFDPRGLPIRFRNAPALKKPGKRASPSEHEAYCRNKKVVNLSRQALELMRNVRSTVDQRGGSNRVLISVLDGSFCNRTIFRAELENTKLVARCRKDARVCFPAQKSGTRRKYDPFIFTPEQVRQNESIPYQKTRIHFGGNSRPIRYKEVNNVLWRRGAGTMPLRLIIIAPQPYQRSPHSRKNYREAAYLLSTDSESDVQLLIQACFDRWQIEVNHRDEKSILGVGQAQVRSIKSVPRHPAFLVATYSMLLLAALNEFGPGRTDDYIVLPKWRKKARRPSLLDIITLLRKEINEARDTSPINIGLLKNLANYAYT